MWQLQVPPEIDYIGVKRFERSNGLDTALYKTIPLPFVQVTHTYDSEYKQV